MEYAGVQTDQIQQYRANARQEARQNMEALCLQAGLNPAFTPALVMHGDPSLMLVQQEQEFDCDLIVMGSRGKAPWKTCFGVASRAMPWPCRSAMY